MNEWIIFWIDICHFWWKVPFFVYFGHFLDNFRALFLFDQYQRVPDYWIELSFELNQQNFFELNNILNWILGKAILNRILNESFFGKIQILNWIRLGTGHHYDLHIKNHKRKSCHDHFNPQKVKDVVPDANLMCAEQTFTWQSRYKKVLNSMTKTRGPKSLIFPDGNFQRAKTFRTKSFLQQKKRANSFRDKKSMRKFFCDKKSA